MNKLIGILFAAMLTVASACVHGAGCQPSHEFALTNSSNLAKIAGVWSVDMTSDGQSVCRNLIIPVTCDFSHFYDWYRWGGASWTLINGTGANPGGYPQVECTKSGLSSCKHAVQDNMNGPHRFIHTVDGDSGTLWSTTETQRDITFF